MHPGSRRSRTAIALGTAFAIVAALTVASIATRPDPDAAEPTATNSIFDAEGNLAMPMPRLAHGFELTPNDDGSTDLSFGVALAVYNTTDEPSAPGAKPDAAIIHTNIGDSMTSLGPFRTQPSFSTVQMDDDLDAKELTRTYTVRIPPAQTAFLKSKGLGSGDPTQNAAALRHIDVAVQHIRDFKSVDGEWDWQQGRAWTAADQPVQASDAIVDDSTVSVTNSTGEGLFDYSAPGGGPSEEVRQPLVAGSSYATNLSLSGQPVQCIEQGDGSDPQGFSLLNGWDIEDDLPPGVLPPGATITQQVNAADGLGDDGLGVAEDATEVAVLSGLAGLGVATPGVESAVTATSMLAMGLSELSTAATIATGIPIGAILELGYALYEELEDSCANYANVFNVTAAEPGGSSASYSWGDQTNGLWQVYDSASVGGSPVTDNVALAPSTGIISFVDPSTGEPETVNPYLAQVPTVACGTGCASQVNNEIEIMWSAASPCPQSSTADCAPTPDQLSTLPEIDVPGTDLCGPGNSLCPPLAAPVPSFSETGSYVSDVEGEPAFAVIASPTPPTPIKAVAVLDDAPLMGGDDGMLYTLASGRVFAQEGSTGSAPINAMATIGAEVLIGTGAGQVYSWDGETVELVQEIPDSSITEMVAAGGGVYLTDDSGQLYFLDASGDLTAVLDTFVEVSPAVDGQAVTSLAANDSTLFAGFANGVVLGCALDDCASSFFQLHDSGFASAANAMTALGNTLYVGLDDGAIAQIDAQDTQVSMAQDAGERGNTIGAMTVVNGNVYVNGCISSVDPVTDDMVGVSVLYGMNQQIDEGGPIGELRPSVSNTCYNYLSADSEYQGYDTSSAAIATSSPTSTATDPAVVYQAFTIDSGSFFYVLENLMPYDPTSGVCIQEAGGCPGPPPASAAEPAALPPVVGALSDLPDPQVTSTCDLSSVGPASYVEAQADQPLTTSQPAATISADGFQLRAPTSTTQACTTSFAWNLSNVGSYPYAWWQANAYLDQSDAQGATFTLAASGAGDQVANLTSGSTTPGGEARVGPGGTQLSVDLSGLTALVLTVSVPAGSADPAVIDLSNDLLGQVGQDQPSPAPLASEPDSASSGTTTTTTVAGITVPPSTTTTSQGGPPKPPPVPPTPCSFSRAALAAKTAALWLLNDTTGVAKDYSGNANAATIDTPSATNVTPGPVGSCPGNGGLAFSGPGGVYAPASLNPATTGSALTLVGSFQLSPSAGTGTWGLVANTDPSSPAGGGFALTVELGPGGAPSASGGLTVTTAQGSNGAATWTRPLLASTWYQYVGVYDGASLAVYLNGVLVGTGSASGPLAPGTGDVAVATSGPPGAGQGWPGVVANVAVIPSALTAAQVANLWSASQ